MNKTIFFSIILPTYNRAYCIEKAINSVINQNFKSWELIIIDDASIDNTYEIVKNYNNKNVKYFKLDVNSGVNIARNYAVQKCIGKYVILLDSDNILKDNILYKFKQIIDKEKFNYIKFACENQNKISTVENIDFYGYIDYPNFLNDKMQGEYSTLVESKLLKEIGFFSDINGGEGITWKLIAKKTRKVLYMNEVALIYDDSGDDRLSNKSKNYKRLVDVFEKDIKVLWKDYLKYSKIRLIKNILKSIIYKIMSKIN